ncbi:DUF2330 domain-containing protein [Nocardia rhizosphaerae]|uniref:DUF2330 domain-containing protein n=1 Tax=Nocardia rhizosphaerae TaxID=1691571 RepID=A0ABV8L2F8_9NOCA
MTTTALRLALAVAALCTGVPFVASADAVPLGPAGQPQPRAEFTNVFLTWDGRTETMIVDTTSMDTETPYSAMVIPTPAPATLRPVESGLFVELNEVAAADVVTQRHWFQQAHIPESEQLFGVLINQPPPGPPHLSGSLSAVADWLSNRGVAVDTSPASALAEYQREGWSFTAVQLADDGDAFSSESGVVSTDEFLLRFDTDRLIYPTRIDRGLPGPTLTRMYVLADHRVTRGDADATQHNVDVEFAGPLPESGRAALSRPMALGNDYLTVLTTTVPDPSTIATDATFVRASSDEPFRDTIVRHENVELLGFPAGYVLIVAGFSVAAVVAGAVLRGRSPR